MSSPRLEPWLIPETISSGRSPISPSSAKRTQSTGVPSVANPLDPSLNGISSTQSGERVVMLRAVALRFESGAITWTSSPSIARRALRSACSPLAWIPSSLVIRTRIRPPILRLGCCWLCARLGGRLLVLGLPTPPIAERVAQVDPGEDAAIEHRRRRGSRLEQFAASGLAELVDAAVDEIGREGDHEHAGHGEELPQVQPERSPIEGDAEPDRREQSEDPAGHRDHGTRVLRRGEQE